MFVAMENGLPKKERFEVKARIFLRVETLKELVALVKNGSAKEAAEALRIAEERTHLEEKLYAEVLAGNIKKATDAYTVLGLKKSESNKVLACLKKQGRIEYLRKQKRWTCVEMDASADGEEGNQSHDSIAGPS